MSSAWFLSSVLVGATVLLSIAGTLLVRRLASVEVLERHNDVAGFIYAVIGVVYAVLLGFAAITVWERYDRAQASVEQEANDLADLYRDAETFPANVRTQLKDQIRDYVRLVVQKEWPAMAVGKHPAPVMIARPAPALGTDPQPANAVGPDPSPLRVRPPTGCDVTRIPARAVIRQIDPFAGAGKLVTKERICPAADASNGVSWSIGRRSLLATDRQRSAGTNEKVRQDAFHRVDKS